MGEKLGNAMYKHIKNKEQWKKVLWKWLKSLQ
jgi:hypothetical protein